MFFLAMCIMSLTLLLINNEELSKLIGDRQLKHLYFSGFPQVDQKKNQGLFKDFHGHAQHFQGPVVDTVQNSNLCCRHFLANEFDCKRNRIAERMYTR